MKDLTTPGSWRLVSNQIINEHGVQVALVLARSGEYLEYLEEQRANARLFANAKRMRDLLIKSRELIAGGTFLAAQIDHCLEELEPKSEVTRVG